MLQYGHRKWLTSLFVLTRGFLWGEITKHIESCTVVLYVDVVKSAVAVSTTRTLWPWRVIPLWSFLPSAVFQVSPPLIRITFLISRFPDDSKESIRQRVWEYLEKENIAESPRPVYGRIPNFKVSNFTVVLTHLNSVPRERLRLLTVWPTLRFSAKPTLWKWIQIHRNSRLGLGSWRSKSSLSLVMHFNWRFLSQSNKTLLVPTPRLQTGLFNKIIPPRGGGKESLHTCATSKVRHSAFSMTVF